MKQLFKAISLSTLYLLQACSGGGIEEIKAPAPIPKPTPDPEAEKIKILTSGLFIIK